MYQVRNKTISNYSRFYKDAGCSYLVTTNNAKTLKGEGYLTSIIHLSPHKLAGVVVNGKRITVCERATAECIGACLNGSGHTEMRMNKLGVNPELKCTECKGDACGDIEWHDGGYICQTCHEKDQREEVSDVPSKK